jgi:DNA replication protein DnaC
MNAFEEVLHRMSENARISNDPDFAFPPTYLNEEDGLQYCSNCHTRRQTRVNFPAPDTVVWGDCDCISKHYAAIKEQGKLQGKLQEEYERLCRMKNDAFPETYAMARHWKFETDDRRGDEKSMQIIRNYADNFQRFYDKGAGLLLYGSVGIGKSFAAACVVNALLDSGISCLMTDFSTIINELTGRFEGKQEYINHLISHELLVIDDLGVQRDTSYANEIVTNVVNARMMSEKPMIVTTNFTKEELLGVKDITYQRTLSRLFECCIPIKFQGEDRRRAGGVKADMELRGLLGI